MSLTRQKLTYLGVLSPILLALSILPAPDASAQTNIFVALRITTSGPATTAINAPAGYSYGAAAPASGTQWNTVDLKNLVGMNSVAGTTSNLYANLPLVNANGSSITPTLSVSYFSKVTTSTKTQPSTASGENSIQPGGVMQSAWRNYYNASGNYFSFSFAGLSPSTNYGLYLDGGTTGSGQGAGVQLSPANQLNGSTTNCVTANATANSAGAYGSLWTVVSGTNSLMPAGTTWTNLWAQSDASGNLTFYFNGGGNGAYLNGFQLAMLSAPGLAGANAQTVTAGNNATLSATVSGLPAPALQWQTNGVNISGATNSSLLLNNVSYAQNGYVYSLMANNISGSATNRVTLTVNVSPGLTGPNDQAILTGNNATISATVSGIPTPALQWQLNDTNLTDGVTGSGSTISGSTSSSLSIADAQPSDSGRYSIIASNSAGLVTNGMTLTVSSGNIAPEITGPANQTAVQGSNATFNVSVSGLPVPTLQWLDQNAAAIPGATNDSLTLTNVSFAQNGFVYSLVASNSAGIKTNGASLTVLVPASISGQPQNITVTNTQSAAFLVTAGGTPAPAYQWYFNAAPITGANGSSYTIAQAAPANIGSYTVVVSNNLNSVTSSVATLTVNSLMGITSLTPANNALNVCYDTPLYLTFNATPTLRAAGKIRIYNANNTVTPVDTIDLSQCVTNQTPYAVNVQPYTINGTLFTNFPVIINGNRAAIYPHQGLLTSNQTYYVTLDDGTFNDGNGAYFAGFSASNVWRFTTKPGGPLNRTNLVVAQDNSGDFVTVQGAVNSVASSSTTPTVINIRNGNYVELVNINSQNNLDLRGQSRNGVFVGYPNNNNVFGGAPQRASFVLNGNDCTVENLTVTNMTPDGGGQAEAVDVEGTRAIFLNMELDSFQDTFLVHSAGKLVYFQDSLIEGQTDFNWGYGSVYYTNCEIRCVLSGGHVTQPRSPYTTNGFGFINCRITQGYSGSSTFDLGRTIGTPTSPSEALFATCLMASTVTGYSNDAGTNMSDYSCSNLTATAPAVLTYSTHLASNNPFVVAIQSAATWLYGWQPQAAANVASQPQSQSVSHGQPATFTAQGTGIPAPAYQWLFNGAPINGATGASYIIGNAVRMNGGNYSVAVNNGSGSATSSVAVLTYIDTPPTAPNFSIVALLGIPETLPVIGGSNPPSDVDGDPLAISSVASGVNGTVITDGSNVTYTASHGPADSFTYTVRDGFGGTATGTVSVTINTNVASYNQLSVTVAGTGTNVMTLLEIPNYNYALDLSTNLLPPINWIPQVTNPANANGALIFTNVNRLPQSFYRVRHVP